VIALLSARHGAEPDNREPCVISAAEVTACLITRGDTDLRPIIDTLPYEDVIVWDDTRPDLKVYGRYQAVREAPNGVVYLQDDDCVFRHHDDLLAAYEPGVLVANWGHGDTPCGYEDVALVHGGAIVDRDLPERAFARYLEHFLADDDFHREADMISGCLTPFKHVRLPYEILPLASHPSRMCNQTWQREKKLRVTNRCRWIRDHASGQPSLTDSMSVTR
jgi:hypothetical protein